MSTRTTSRALGIGLAFLACSAGTAGAQDPDEIEDRRWLSAFSVGVPGYGTDAELSYFTLGGRWTRLSEGRPGFDLGLDIVPRWLAEGIFGVTARPGVVLPVRLGPRVMFLPSAGLTLFGVMGQGGAGQTTGYNAGLALVTLSASGRSMRFAASRHWEWETASQGSIWLVEVGIGRGPRGR